MAVSEYEYYGRTAFEAWREYQGWTNPDGSPIPDWDALGETLQQAWVAAGNAATKAYQGES